MNIVLLFNEVNHMELQYNGSGKVTYGDKDYECSLYLNKDEGGSLIKIIDRCGKPFSSFLELPIEIPYLSGQLESGFIFTLMNLKRTKTTDMLSYGYTEYVYNADYIFCGVNTNGTEPTFHQINCTFSNIVEWGEESIYKIGEKYELISRDEGLKETLFKGAEFSINYSVYGSLLPVSQHELLKEQIVLEQHGVFEIVFQHEESFQKFNLILTRLKSLLEIATLRKNNVENVVAYSSESTYLLGDKRVERPISVYGKNILKSKKMTESNINWIKWIRKSELVNHNSFECYFENYEKLAPIIELFLEPFYVEGISETKVFLNIVQALETYHSRFITNRMDEFKDRVAELVSGFPDGIREEKESFLLANSNRFITLESRLADLLLANDMIYFDTGDIQHNDFPSVISHTRHYYIHYDESIKDTYRVLSNEELQIYNSSLLQILDYYIRLELGYSESENLKGMLINRWGNISQNIEIMKMSRQRFGTENE